MLHITSIYASVLALIILFLCFKVVSVRRSQKIEIGDGGDPVAMRYIRAQQNAVEYIPMALILMGAYEINGGSALVIYIVGALLCFGRIIHPFGFIKKKGINFGRFFGTLITWICIATFAVLNIYNSLI